MMLSRQSIITFIAGFGVALGLSFNVNTTMPDCNISLDKNNIMYNGIDNPATVVVSGVPDNQVRVESDSVTVTKVGPSKYIFKSNNTGKAPIKVIAGGQEKVFQFRVKRIPDPVVVISGANHQGGLSKISNGQLKASGRVDAILENFDLDCKCETIEFDLLYHKKKQDPTMVTNKGPLFNGQVRSLIGMACPGDKYIFEKIKVHCPGDVVDRIMGPVEFLIK
jgi:hypothetical protein